MAAVCNAGGYDGYFKHSSAAAASAASSSGTFAISCQMYSPRMTHDATTAVVASSLDHASEQHVRSSFI